jgi:hypothetical protein
MLCALTPYKTILKNDQKAAVGLISEVGLTMDKALKKCKIPPPAFLREGC